MRNFLSGSVFMTVFVAIAMCGCNSFKSEESPLGNFIKYTAPGDVKNEVLTGLKDKNGNILIEPTKEISPYAGVENFIYSKDKKNRMVVYRMNEENLTPFTIVEHHADKGILVLKGNDGMSIIRTKAGKTRLIGPVKDYVFDNPFLLTKSEKGWRFEDLIDEDFTGVYIINEVKSNTIFLAGKVGKTWKLYRSDGSFLRNLSEKTGNKIQVETLKKYPDKYKENKGIRNIHLYNLALFKN